MALVVGRSHSNLSAATRSSANDFSSRGAGPTGGDYERRWVGRQTAVIDAQMISKCTEDNDMGKITALNFHFSFLEKISGLDKCAPHLRSLDLSSNNIRVMEGLGGMAKLKELKLYSCQLTKIEGLEECAALVALHLEDNQLTTLEGLSHLRTLEFLSLDKNRITQLGKSVSKLTKLREFRIARNQLEDLEGLSSLTSLETLSVAQNLLKKVAADNFKGLSKLDDLNLSGNKLVSLAFLKMGASTPTLPNLSILDLSENCLTAKALKVLPTMHQMTELNLNDNQLEEVPEDISRSCPGLEILQIAANRIESVDALGCLKTLVSLRELGLAGNPVSVDDMALQRFLTSLPALEYLDDETKPNPPPDAIEDGEADEEEKTFQTTVALSGPSPSASSSAFRPGSSGSGTMIRPETGSSRPGTAQSMKDRGIQEPLMHLQLKVKDRNFATAEQVTQWEKKTLNSLAAIDVQIQRTLHQADNDLASMDRCLERAEEALRRRDELKAKGLLQTLPEEGSAWGVAGEGSAAAGPGKAASRLRGRCEEYRSTEVDIMSVGGDDEMSQLGASARSFKPIGQMASSSSSSMAGRKFGTATNFFDEAQDVGDDAASMQSEDDEPPTPKVSTRNFSGFQAPGRNKKTPLPRPRLDGSPAPPAAYGAGGAGGARRYR